MSRLQELLSMIRGYYEEFVDALREYERGEERVYAVERLAQLIAQCILDFAAVLASRERGAKPGSYRELARWLARRAGLGSDLAEFLEGLAGFRNILVHMYAEINRELEMEAFREIAEKTPHVVARLAELARDDPCIGEVKQRIRRAAERLGLRLVLLFGSLARSGCGRDVDLAVRLGRRPRSMLEVGRLQAVLEDELGVPVDLVVLDLGVSPALAKTLVDEAVLVYGDPGEAEEELLRLYKLYLDHVEASKARAAAAGPQRQ
ncbi:type VII toxin-antitoxin system HepT family RNase toxin [Pyrodictium abyssi]